MTRLILFLSLVLIAGCGRRVNVQFSPEPILLTNNVPTTNMVISGVRITYANEDNFCSYCRFHEYKIVTDGNSFKVLGRGGNLWQSNYKDCREAQETINWAKNQVRSECPQCAKKIWKEVECK